MTYKQSRTAIFLCKTEQDLANVQKRIDADFVPTSKSDRDNLKRLKQYQLNYIKEQ